MKHSIPKEIQKIADALEEGGFEAYLVGGCLRDLLLKREPKDWDIATNAIPEEIQKLFPDSMYENQFGTVGVKTRSEEETLKIVEITTYRIEGGYRDLRHPEEVCFAKTIQEDLARRDFTVNAIALSLIGDTRTLIDPFGGVEDLSKKSIRAVGNPEVRFREDALRLLRAVRFAADLDFEIETQTLAVVKHEAGLLEVISKERIRDELLKIIITKQAAKGIILLEDTQLLKYVVPELREGIGCGQNKHHVYSVFDHNVRALNYAVEKNYSLEVRLASLFHDIGKPRTKGGEGINSTFYGHEIVGAKMTRILLDRLRVSKDLAEKVVHLVRCHLFYYNVGEVTEAGVRRFLSRVGPEHVDDLLKVREADRIGSGVPKAFPYKLRHLLFMIEKVKQDPIHPKMLKVKGDDVMKILNIPASPRIGFILSILLEEVLDEPVNNEEKYLKDRIRELETLSEKELKEMSEKARERKEEYESGIEADMKTKHRV